MTELHLFLVFCGIKYGLEHSPREQSVSIHSTFIRRSWLYLLLFFIFITEIIFSTLRKTGNLLALFQSYNLFCIYLFRYCKS